MKNYIGFVNDHSGSMDSLRTAAINDYNANITATKNAASREMLDTIVSVVGIGLPSGDDVKRQVVISNPHVLKPVTTWPTPGGTPLWDGVGNMIELFESLPDYYSPDVSFLVITTTDGQEQHSKHYTHHKLADKIEQLQKTGRWTFVFRVPRGGRRYLQNLPIPAANIQEWDTTEKGMEQSTVETTQAMDAYFTGRVGGIRSSNVFYANASAVATNTLKDVTKDVSLYVVDDHLSGIWIRDFILTKRMQYLKGSAFYQLTKTEPRVTHTKLIAIRERATGKIYAGNEARQMIGLPTDRNARLHPGDHGAYDIFIQSESVNRKLVGGTGVLYWEAIGKPFTEAELEYLKPKAVTPAVVQLPAVAPTNKPTPNPLKVPKVKILQHLVDGKPVKYFPTRELARASGKSVQDTKVRGSHCNGGQRWFVFL